MPSRVTLPGRSKDANMAVTDAVTRQTSLNVLDPESAEHRSKASRLPGGSGREQTPGWGKP